MLSTVLETGMGGLPLYLIVIEEELLFSSSE
jgi:hypothetical protein